MRVHQKWFYVQADIKDLRGSSSPKAAKPASSLSKEYQKLARAVLERKQNEEADGRATQLHDDSTSQRDSKDERGACDATDSGYISEDGRAKEAGDSDLQDWLLAPLGEPMAEVFGNGSKSKAGSSKHLTLSEWYRTEVFAFTLQVSPEGELVAVQMNDFNADDFARKHVTHTMALPKYLQHVPQVPWYSPGDIHVLSQSDDIHLPIHPTLVSAPRRVSKQEQKLFLKLATPDTEPSIKREIRLLHELAKRDVHSRGLRAPRLEGLVASPFSPKSRTRILGFLLTLIPQPSTPLTELMSTRIAASKREGWAQETERMVKLLHEHGYIWGVRDLPQSRPLIYALIVLLIFLLQYRTPKQTTSSCLVMTRSG